ncbi:phosphoglycerate kinase [Wohlfahrtiimonas chitiniclastica]|uniref:phosphoglycerate kinase n=1 Tax=Wohlfahrtiimonas chitiniclastica TaxID=400946 RepID=UPI000B9838FB|nr:phosphoglycerate kinase [Wohlfahrtiimonas chitiniclastica]MBS7814932.1 phosphoglycerate kinase [Wohlfahrtiimonas chitiniclastica]MBS7820848.1 phosphoglycerate kinase [Wohlfahrtiimonas chitiniclastica]OYQ70507.1 phosphoglycerate kinase [Wohlfahrtiimonas chitiniclastica]OYQ82199.1 phosphoglycerate kinase [Wohlfahrtiimonas chitiniclastica]OYQ83723.1 phosphoglycerate kinase [Wohlfahrtiimonas chitiniclastica]
MRYNKMENLDLVGKTVLIREDLNVPIHDGKITSDARLVASMQTIEQALKQGAGVLVMSHLGRPEEGVFNEEYSLAPVATWLSDKLGFDVPLVKDWIDGVTVEPGKVKLLENTRFLVGEGKNNPELAKKMAALCDVFVMDAFATAHRSAASTVGVGDEAKVACAGMVLSQELDALKKGLMAPEHPIVAIVGGSKVSTKLTVLNQLLDKVDVLITGGGITNTLLLAEGFSVGKSLAEADLVADAKALLDKAKATGKNIPLPVDVVVGKAFDANTEATVKKIADVSSDDMIMDIGPETAKLYAELIKTSKTVVWNGPVGVFEFASFAEGTKAVGDAIKNSQAFSIAGGGDTVAAIEQFGLTPSISYISTAGGAFLEFLEGKELPAVAMLERKAN